MKFTIVVAAVVACVLAVTHTWAKPHVIQIGALFGPDEEDQELAFKHVVDYINKEKLLNRNVLVGIVEHIEPSDQLQVHRRVCSMLASGVYAIFGPSSTRTSHYVQSVCDSKEVPHIEMKWNMKQQRGGCQLNLYPHSPVLSSLYASLVLEYEWKNVLMLYEDDHSLSRLSRMFTLSEEDLQLMLKQLDPTRSGDYRPILKEAKWQGYKCFVLDCSIAILEDVLKQALQVGLMSDEYHFIITNLDVQTINLYPFKHGGVNITGLQLVNPHDKLVEEVSTSLQELKMSQDPFVVPELFPGAKMRVDTALIYDAVFLFVEAIRQLSFSRKIRAKPLYCNSTDNWEHGYSLINYMKMISMKGLSGFLKFDHQGFRSDFELNVVEFGDVQPISVGSWNSTTGLSVSRTFTSVVTNEEGMESHSLIVLIALSAPYGMRKQSTKKLEGNDRFEGYAVDLVHELSLLLRFNYTFVLQEDGKYGAIDPITGKWDGMIKELLASRADLGITDFTITFERESVVDFTMPFMPLGISILYKKPMKMPPKLFSFMSPFSDRIWYSFGGLFVGLSLFLFVIARLGSAEWTNKHPCMSENEYLPNQFNMNNSFWFIVSALLRSGTGLAPLSASTRLLTGAWRCFTLILISTYTANLAAFLTVETLSTSIRNIDDLANQNVIKYGAKLNGATANFFRDSHHPTYQKIWKYMEEHPEDMTTSNDEGVKRAELEDYAFFMESTSIEYTTEVHCNLTQVGGLLDQKGYGIAMRKNIPYHHLLSATVVKLQENGKLAELKKKWWKDKRGANACQNEGPKGSASELGLANLGGVFLVLVVGLGVSIFICIGELLLHVGTEARKEKISFFEKLKEEIKFIMKFGVQVKPVKKYTNSRLNIATKCGE